MKRKKSTAFEKIINNKKNNIEDSCEELSESDDVYPFPVEDIEKFVNVEWISSHLQPDKVLWSSDHVLLPPSVEFCAGVVDDENGMGETNDVVNTFFVQNPLKSEVHGADDWVEQIRRAGKIIEEAENFLIVAGAGMGVDSGLPDYRGQNGFWKAYPALQEKGLTLESMSHPDWFKTDPKSAWGFYGHRAELYENAEPHEGFKILRDIAERKEYFIFTSNIDSQFQKSGFPNAKIYEAHGTLGYLQCIEENCNKIWPTSDYPIVDDKLNAISELPICPRCSALGRPNVSMFGDTNISFKKIRSEKQKKQFLKWLTEHYGSLNTEPEQTETTKLVIIEIGCGTSLHSIRLEVDLLASRQDVTLIRINPVDFTVTNNKHIGIGLGALSTLKAIEKNLSQNL